MITADFHIHSRFSDGADTPEELVKTALRKGFTALGFSEHSFTEMDKAFALPPEKTAAYRAEIKRLKEKYAGEIDIFCGIEQDYFSAEPTADYDYVIGSVHYVRKNGVYLAVDESAVGLKKEVDAYYSGDFDALAADYFALVADVPAKTNADIIGHFDLVSKYAAQNGYGESTRYLHAAESAVRRLAPLGLPFEINTGAMARGAKTVPYPSPAILQMIRDNGGQILFSSDCHKKENLGFAFDRAVRTAREIGFTKYAVITANGMEYKKL